MLLVNVHEFDVVFTDPVRLGVLKREANDVWGILRFHCQDVLVGRASQNFGQGGQVDAESDVSVAAKG
jgi:hypothetical protein